MSHVEGGERIGTRVKWKIVAFRGRIFQFSERERQRQGQERERERKHKRKFYGENAYKLLIRRGAKGRLINKENLIKEKNNNNNNETKQSKKE